jgi:glutathione S-transferase
MRPEPNLIPIEPKARARAIWYEEFSDTMLCACGGKMFFNRIVAPRFLGRQGDDAVADEAEKKELPGLLDYLEQVLPVSGFLVEDRLTLADIAVASPFANFGHLGLDLGLGERPKLAAFVDRMLARPSFKAYVDRESAFLARAA